MSKSDIVSINLGHYQTTLVGQSGSGLIGDSFISFPSRQSHSDNLAPEEYWESVAHFWAKHDKKFSSDCELSFLINAHTFYARYLEFPKSQEQTWIEALEQHAWADLPIGGKGWILTWNLVPSLNLKFPNAVFYCAIETDIIEQIHHHCQRLNLPLGSVEPDLYAEARFLQRYLPSVSEPGYDLCIDLGYEETRVLGLYQNELYFYQGFDLGIKRFIYAMEVSLEVGFQEAEKELRELKDHKTNYTLSTKLEEWQGELKKIWTQCQRAVEADWDSIPRRVVLFGGGSRVAGVKDYCKQLWDIPVVQVEEVTEPPKLEGEPTIPLTSSLPGLGHIDLRTEGI